LGISSLAAALSLGLTKRARKTFLKSANVAVLGIARLPACCHQLRASLCKYVTALATGLDVGSAAKYSSTLYNQQGSQANPGVSGSGAAAVIPPAPITYDQFAMHTNPQLNAGSDSGSDFQAKRQYMIDQIMGSNVSVAAKSQQINAVMDLLSSVPAPVSSLRSSGRSSQPEPFNGRAADHGQTAISWLYSVELYFAAEPTSCRQSSHIFAQ